MYKRDEIIEDAKNAIIEALQDGYSGDYGDLHNEVFNTDYYIIGKEKAIEALEEYGVFDAIKEVQTFERFAFGSGYTDVCDPEKLVNMLYYIIGEECMSELYKHPAFHGQADAETNDDLVNYLIVERGW